MLGGCFTPFSMTRGRGSLAVASTTCVTEPLHDFTDRHLSLLLCEYLVGVVKPGLNERFVKAIVARVLHDALVLNAKARRNVGLAHHFPGLRGTPDCVLCYHNDIAAPEAALCFESQPGTSEPVSQQLVPVTRAARANHLDIRV